MKDRTLDSVVETRLNYGCVLKGTYKNLRFVQEELEKLLKKHDVQLVYQHSSVKKMYILEKRSEGGERNDRPQTNQP